MPNTPAGLMLALLFTQPSPVLHTGPLQVQLNAKAKEAELNARMLSLESQIHWLTEQNSHLQQAAQSGDSAAAVLPAELEAQLNAKIAELEGELRKSKRAEQKMQALFFR